MKSSLLLILSLFILAPVSHAGFSATATQFEFDPAELKGPSTVPFSNRAACALDSRKAASSAFLIVDSYNAGKQLNSWLQGLPAGTAGDMTVEKGLKIFRLSVSEIWMTVMQDLLSGKLPLLRANPDPKLEKDYSRILTGCKNQYPCAAMDTYLTYLFVHRQTAAMSTATKNPYMPFFSVDNYANRPELLRGRHHPQASCLYVKRFSDLQSNWNHDRPDQALLQKIALASLARDGLFTDCFDESDDLPSRRFMLQLDISEASKKAWNRHGFDFWYSMKLYFSYAWRNSEYILGKSEPINKLFKSLAVEQMVQLVSSGCESIERPECTQSQVSMDIFRALGRLDAGTELDKPLPDRPEQLLIRDDLSLRHEDSGILPESGETETWVKGYQERIIQRRGAVKQRLLLAISQFEMISKAMNLPRTRSELDFLKKNLASNPTLYKKMHVMCTEIDIAVRPDVNLLEKRFETTLQIEKFKKIVEGATDTQLSSMVDYYMAIAQTTFPICEAIRLEKLWNQNVTIPVTSHATWYRDLSGTWSAPVPQPDGSTPAPDFLGMGDLFNQTAATANPFLVQEKVDADGFKTESVVCADASDCVRMLLKSMVDLYAVSAWADAMMPVSEWIQSPNLANQWSSATACEVYDPWFATKQAMGSLATDLGMTVVTGVAPIPAYLAIQPKHRDVKAFQLDPQGDEVFLKPMKKGRAAEFSIGVDLGPWLGIPCAAVFSPTSTRPQIGGYYSVASVRGELCTGKDNHRLIVNEGSTPGENKRTTYSGCAMCYLNPYSAAVGVAKIASYAVPGLRIAVGAIFSGVSLVKRLHNPVDVPHRYEVDIEEVSSTFEKYSFIPKRCTRRLSKGKSCKQANLTKSERKTYKEFKKQGPAAHENSSPLSTSSIVGE